MAKEKKKFVFEKLETTPVVPQNIENQQNSIAVLTNVTTTTVTKVTFDCPNDLIEVMKNFGYWEGMSQREIILEALEVFFEDKKIKERPDKVKNRKKVGRKPKNLVNNFL